MMLRENYRIGVPFAGTYSEVFNTEWTEFGGAGISNGTDIKTEDEPMHGHEQSIVLTLPPMSVMYFKCTRKKPKRKLRKKATEGETAVKKTSKKKSSKKAETVEAAAEEVNTEEKPKKRTRKKKTETPEQ